MEIGHALKILGMTSVDDVDVKSRFRAVSRKLHPDNVDTGDKDAFQEASDAFMFLKALTPEELRVAIIRASAEARCDDAEVSIKDSVTCVYTLPVTNAQILSRSKLSLEPGQKYKCLRCDGSGREKEPDQCQMCAGKGAVKQTHKQIILNVQCPNCKGDGRNYDEPCYSCGGQKHLTVEKPVPVGKSAGRNSEQIFETKLINAANKKTIALCAVRKNSEHEMVRGSDILVIKSVPLKTLKKGGDFVTNLPCGLEVDIDIKPNTPTNKRVKIPGYGFYKPSGSRGNAWVELEIEKRKKSSPFEEKLIRVMPFLSSILKRK